VNHVSSASVLGTRRVVTAVVGMPFTFALEACLMTAVVGMFFGTYPAMRAAALDPIEALRKE